MLARRATPSRTCRSYASGFAVNFFSRNPRPFFALAREMFPGMFDPTPTHFFLRLLAEKGLLRRIYTQNIVSSRLPATAWLV